jgi:hypothetical protein
MGQPKIASHNLAQPRAATAKEVVMALSWLYTEVLVVVSEPWVKDGEAAKAAIAKVSLLAALSPQ